MRAPDHARPVDGVDYDQVVTEKLERSPQSAVREVLGERQPSGLVLAKLRDGRGAARPVLHAPDCEEAPAGDAPQFDVDRALDAAEQGPTRGAAGHRARCAYRTTVHLPLRVATAALSP
ncbi:hypothetical protein [Streptomyces sp. V4I2]|uniref:hypothetical protein n=1 Tax=Streptomyces sp. V4I2 TaxID=3042280 RepID=UPI0027D8D4C8|nr:hypothetical protein [Streptomyces sp. V4I2]